MQTSVIIVMGVSGCGKSTVGQALADRLGWRFADADDFHPPENVQKMRSGQPLNDNDRAPWLDTLNRLMRQAQADQQPMVLACSALKQRYRDRLASELCALQWVHLSGSFELISQRVAARQHKYMPAALLKSQFDALEPPVDAINIAIAKTMNEIVDEIAANLR